MCKYSNVRASEINRLFPNTVPCSCYDDPTKLRGCKMPMYNVTIVYGSTNYDKLGRLVREITVECDYCGESYSCVVEDDGVYENEIPW